MPRNIMSIGRIMYSKMPTKRKLSDFYGFGLPSIILFFMNYLIYVISFEFLITVKHQSTVTMAQPMGKGWV